MVQWAMLLPSYAIVMGSNLHQLGTLTEAVYTEGLVNEQKGECTLGVKLLSSHVFNAS